MIWRPYPMSSADLPSSQERFVIATPDGDQTHPALTLGMYSAVPVVDDLELLAVMVADTALKVGSQVDAEMARTGRVADTQDWEMTLTVRARVKTWPAIPGVTLPPPDPDECPRCGTPNDIGHFEFCPTCRQDLASENPMPGESS